MLGDKRARKLERIFEAYRRVTKELGLGMVQRMRMRDRYPDPSLPELQRHSRGMIRQ